ncbi:MAG: hypothetical protein A2289_08520 [Deltaproteobacteria bacterium RIFOXYA12_FULL_58_15]|nr:MAG: hypothetical protein A2289_08520 [Deltaproteobacteria bacterium RIFOXYA12_FULL_58_15]OGR10829.1 MAG: hypothetical protein A2341_23530 [Deltaproteobacteria bacterium RIFOXYB12_FULL_58_9]
MPSGRKNGDAFLDSATRWLNRKADEAKSDSFQLRSMLKKTGGHVGNVRTDSPPQGGVGLLALLANKRKGV